MSYKNSLFVFFVEGQLFCSCGHFQGFTEDETHNYYRGKDRIMCEECGNEQHLPIHLNRYNRVVNAVGVYENGDKVSLSTKIGSYFWNEMIDKPTYTDQSIRLTFNTKTGNLYLLQGKKVRNMTYGSANETFFRLFSELESEFQEKIKEFVQLCFQKRGLNFKEVSDFTYTNGVLRFWDAMLYAKFPQLENIPLNLTFIPSYVRKQLNQAKTKREIYKVLFGTNAKTVHRHMKDNEDYYTLHLISQVIKKPENIEKMLSLMQFTIRYKTSNGAETEFPFPFETKDEEIKVYKEQPLRVSNNTHEIFQKYSYFEDEAALLVKFMKDMVRVYKNETLFVNRLQKELKKVDDYKEKQLNLYNILIDIYRMYTHIIEVNPDYRVEWKNQTFKRIHDVLSEDIKLYKKPNEVISYKENENIKESEYEGYKVVLAPDTDFLIDVGNKMNICVGGYGSAAVKRNKTIAVFYKGDEPHVCVALDPNKVIREAKLSRNRTPERDEAIAVRRWANDSKVIWNRCADLKYAMNA